MAPPTAACHKQRRGGVVNSSFTLTRTDHRHRPRIGHERNNHFKRRITGQLAYLFNPWSYQLPSTIPQLQALLRLALDNKDRAISRVVFQLLRSIESSLMSFHLTSHSLVPDMNHRLIFQSCNDFEPNRLCVPSSTLALIGGRSSPSNI